MNTNTPRPKTEPNPNLKINENSIIKAPIYTFTNYIKLLIVFESSYNRS